MRNSIVFTFILLFLVGCSAKHIVLGEYASGYNSKKAVPYSLTIKADSTFLYSYNHLHAYEYSSGTWNKKRNGRIVLGSTLQDIRLPLNVTKLSGMQNERINQFSFLFSGNKRDIEDYKCVLVINDSIREAKRCGSLTLIELEIPVNKLVVEIWKSPAAQMSFRFSLDPLTTMSYYTDKPYGNDDKFNIMINDSLFSYKVLTNRKVKVKKDSLMLYNEKGNKKNWLPRLKTIS